MIVIWLVVLKGRRNLVCAGKLNYFMVNKELQMRIIIFVLFILLLHN